MGKSFAHFSFARRSTSTTYSSRITGAKMVSHADPSNAAACGAPHARSTRHASAARCHRLRQSASSAHSGCRWTRAPPASAALRRAAAALALSPWRRPAPPACLPAPSRARHARSRPRSTPDRPALFCAQRRASLWAILICCTRRGAGAAPPQKKLVQSPNSFFMDVKCPGCFNITTVFSHAQSVVICSGCSTVLCQPTGGKARLTEGCSFRKKVE